MNNRQNGRRRGRGGTPRPNGGGNMPNERGNRIDNRSRGNASQLYEKYKTLARDMQTQGDRVMTEYYLQFADHYFRVLAETRPRFDEQQQRRPQGDQFDDFDDGDGDMDAIGDDRDPRDMRDPPQQRDPRDQPQQRDQQPRDQRDARDQQPREAREPREQQRDPRDQRDQQQPPRRESRYEPREPRPETARDDRGEAPAGTGEQPQLPYRAEGDEAPRSRRRGRREFPDRAAPAAANGANGAEDEAHRLEADRLPPAFARAPEPIEVAPPMASPMTGIEGEPHDAPEPAPRRTRRPRRPAGGDEAAVAVEA